MPDYIYCVSCMANSEAVVARSLEERLDVRAVCLSYDREERKNGVWRVVTHPMLWGYVFLYADEPVELSRIYQIDPVNLVLRYDDGDCNLRGGDRAFALRVLACDGRIGLSQALLVGGKTRIVGGPLKNYEGVIKSFDRHKRFAWVDVNIGNETKPIRMYFEWLTVQDGTMVRLRDSVIG